MRTAYKCRVYPDAAQAAQLSRVFGCVRFVWNQSLAARQERYAATGKGIPYLEASKALTAMRANPDYEWLTEVARDPQQQALRHQQRAYDGFFAKRTRYPRFKSRQGRQAATYMSGSFKLIGNGVRLCNTSTVIPFVWTWPDADLGSLKVTSLTVSRDTAGRYFVALSVDVPDIDPLPPTGQSVGVDLGLKDFAVLSTGERIPHPRHMDRHEQRLKRYQRQLARKQKGSANRAKAKVKVARQHARVVDARRDFLHKTSTDLVRRFDAIAIEDLNVAGMVRNRSLAKAISRTGWADFRTFLTYKSERYGRTLVVIDRFYPSSKTCSACGCVLTELALGTREWTCNDCGTRHDRDINAAKNIMTAAGLAVAACGGDVRRGGETLSAVAVEAGS